MWQSVILHHSSLCSRRKHLTHQEKGTTSDLAGRGLHSGHVSFPADDRGLYELLHLVWDEALLLHVERPHGRLHAVLVRLAKERCGRSKHGHLRVSHGCTVRYDTEAIGL